MTDLPCGWINTSLSEICGINPRLDKSAFEKDELVSFIPMPAVEAETGNVDVSEVRTFSQVKQGYTPFKKDDVLFAKITPCMENGKMAIVPEMASEYGFGSTEFHVLRPAKDIDPRFIYHVVSNQSFRYHAEHNMTGAVGQKRVPVTILEEHEIWLPPIKEQLRIVEKIETLFDEIDKGVESLKAAKATLGFYRQSLLKSAFEGRLTADWREQNPDKLEDPETLLARIQAERETRYKAALDDWQEALDAWRTGGEFGKKPAKPKRPTGVKAQHISDENSPYFPCDWGNARFGTLNVTVSDGPFGSNLKTSDYTSKGVRVIRLENIGYGDFLEDKCSYVSEEKYETIKKHSVYPETIVISSFVTDAVRSCIVPKSIPLAINKADCFAAVLKGDQTNLTFAAYYFQSPQVFNQVNGLIHGVGRPRINTTQVKELHFPICSPAEQAEIVRLLDEKLDAADALEAEIDASLTRASALRQSILKKAFSGQLVPQDPNDEPASVLLERIKAEKTVSRGERASSKRGRNAGKKATA
ncbi:restriction endonuclease subunit S [Halomonas sp. Mc5H-6]|uniref:restriction endonuclease subunit S n=1 Tax=Halomonas sp. Mc5H-6 TaxID=2954500 RepID=UPI002096FC9A|nr:restriction endonuclease subunit S [Halomonas sp. Mc5H-6]MCO7247258.1 restriction endonuclease subunit S [Halomonas sp. Mc5H-6]